MAKSSKATARYQDSPKGAKCCRDCAMFKAPSSCTSVEGPVKPTGWCSYFEAKTAKPSTWRNQLGD